MNKEEIKQIYNVIGRYNLENYVGYNIKDIQDQMAFEVDPIPCKWAAEKLTKEQLALAVVIYNSVEICWYQKSRNRGLGANFLTPTYSLETWSEMAESFLEKNPELSNENWISYLEESWPDNYDDLDDEE